MKTKLLNVLIATILLLISNANFGQTPDLGTAANFGLFTKVGALENTGPSYVTGNVGTDAGAFSGFAPATITGEVELGNDTTAQAALDVEALYISLVGLPCGATLGTTLGNNQVLTPNVYCLGAAAVITGDLFLDAQGDHNAIFIFQINGAFAPDALSKVILINKASMCNVYWQVNGAFATGANSVFRGNIVVNGAVALYDGSYLAGRAFSRVGAVALFNSNVVALVTQPIATIIAGDSTATEITLTASVDNASGPFSYLWSPGGETDSSITVSSEISGSYEVIVTAMNGCSDAMDTYEVAGTPLPVELLSFSARCDNQKVIIKWSTTSETNNDYFSVERFTNGTDWQVIAQVDGAGNSTARKNYSCTDKEPRADVIFYRLRQTDFDGKVKYFNIIDVENCIEDASELDIRPNPAKGALNLFFNGDKDKINSISIYNESGKKIYRSGSYQSVIDLSNQPEGIYFLYFNTASKNIIKKLMIKK